MQVALADLRLRARERADMVGSNFIEDGELDNYINAAYSDLYDVLVSRWEDYYTIEDTLTVAAGANSCALPDDFYKLVALDKGDTEVLKFSFKDRHTVTDLSYRIVKNELVFLPKGVAPGTYTLWYVPTNERLVASDDTMDDVNNWSDYIVVSAAIVMLTKEESDTQALLIEKRSLLDRIEAMAANRDASSPERISEVWSPYNDALRVRITEG